MGYIAMDRAKEAIVKSLSNKEKNYGRHTSILTQDGNANFINLYMRRNIYLNPKIY